MEEYILKLNEKEMMLLSAATFLSVVASSIPEVFDIIQLSTKPEISYEQTKKYAEAAILLLDNRKEHLELIKKLNLMVK